MPATIMKYIAVATLVVGVVWHLTPNLRSYLDFVVAAAAVFVSVQAIFASTCGWPHWRSHFFFSTPSGPSDFPLARW